MEWQVIRTTSFDKWWKKEKIENSNYRYYESALAEFQNITLPHNVQSRLFANASFEGWVTRLPDKERKRGKRCGLRAVFVLDLEEKNLLLQGIFRREHLSFEGNSGKYQDAFDELIKELAREFVAYR